MTNQNKERLPIAMLILLILWFIAMFATLGRCSTQPRPNGLGVLQTYDNPWTYMVGAPVHVNLFENKGHYYTNVEFKALGASMLNTVPVLFCGNQLGAFEDSKLRAVTYRTQAARNYQSIGCHEILPIDAGVIVLE